MPCYHPLHAFLSYSWQGTTLKRRVHFNNNGKDFPQDIPCGQCIGCRLERSRQWAIRCVHEASLHEQNTFISLTYDDDHLPPGGSLVKTHFQKFMKRLRKACGQMRYYHCGEYGETLGRPHHHACLFGFDFEDKTPWTTRNGFPVYRSATLERIWPNGNSEIGSVTFESAAYVARYIMKKITGPAAPQHYEGRTPEYTSMSRRPGIGTNWRSTYEKELLDHDSIVIRGIPMKPPRAYDVALEITHPGRMEEIRQARRDAATQRQADNTPERLATREIVATAQLNQLKRNL